jgi:hypothetical protein
MWNDVFKWIGLHYPVLGILIVAIATTIFLCNKYFHWIHRIENAEKESNKIENKIIPELTDIKKSINELGVSFKGLLYYMQGKDSTFSADIFKTNSPITLTELGMNILKSFGGNEYIDTHTRELIADMESHNIKSALDSQVLAPLVIANHASQDSFKKIKDHLYNNPFYKYENQKGELISLQMDMQRVCQIMGIYLRDKYLAIHPEFKSEDIPDLHVGA